MTRELAAAAPLEVFPVEAMPVQAAIGWMTRLLLLSGRHAPLLAFLGALFENTALLGFLLPIGTAMVSRTRPHTRRRYRLPYSPLNTGAQRTRRSGLGAGRRECYPKPLDLPDAPKAPGDGAALTTKSQSSPK